MPNILDITGQRFGRLTVLKQDGSNKYRQTLWVCQCDCGSLTTVIGSQLKLGRTQSCGCLQKDVASKVHKVDLTGKTFGRLTVLSVCSTKLNGAIQWNCLCECGKSKIVRTSHLISGGVKSCGCLKKLHSGRKKT